MPECGPDSLAEDREPLHDARRCGSRIPTQVHRVHFGGQLRGGQLRGDRSRQGEPGLCAQDDDSARVYRVTVTASVPM